MAVVVLLGLRPLIGVSEALCFLVVRLYECLRACVRLSVCAVNTTFYNPIDGISPTLADDVLDHDRQTDMILKVEGSSQGHSTVKHLNELSRRAEASTSTLGRRSII